MTLTNNSSAATTSWTTTFSIPSGHSLDTAHVTNGAFTVSGQSVTVKNLSKNGSLAPGSSITFTMIIDMPSKGTPALNNLQAVANGPVTPPTLSAPVLQPISNPNNGNQYQLSWSAVQNAQTYTLQESTTSGFANPQSIFNGSATTFQVTGKSDGTYFYRVTAAAGSATSAPSNIQSTTVQTAVSTGPIVVDDAYVKAHGAVVSGNFTGTVSQPAITITTSTPVTISNSNLQGPGDLIYATNANVSVINTKASGTNPNIYGTAKGMFLHVEVAINVLVKNCIFKMWVLARIYVPMLGTIHPIKPSHLSTTKSQTSTVVIAMAIMGILERGKRSAFQLNAVQNVPFIEVAWNEIINVPRLSFVDDNINMFESSGTSASHIRIHDNYVQGAYPINPGGESYVGGGIICDGETTIASQTVAFVDIYNNQVVSSANYGVAIAAGHDNAIYNNRVVSCGHLADGTLYTTNSAVAAYNWNGTNQPSAVFFNNNVHDNNPLGLIRASSSGSSERSDWWVPGQNNGSNGNVSWQPYNTQSPTINDEANEYQIWLNKVKAANQDHRPYFID